MKKLIYSTMYAFAFVLFINATGCNETNTEKVASDTEKVVEKAEKPKKEKESKPKKVKDATVEISTDFGKMTVLLYGETPKHNANMIKLAEEGFFEELLFHRVIKGFMIQGGDPKSKGAASGVRLGGGGPGYTVDAEFNPKFIHKKGALAAARRGGSGNPEKKSSGSQFYIVQGKPVPATQLTQLEARINNSNPGLNFKYTPEQIEIYTTIGGTPMLDMDYTVFGEVTQGMDVIDKIANTKTAPGDRPIEDVKMSFKVLKK